MSPSKLFREDGMRRQIKIIAPREFEKCFARTRKSSFSSEERKLLSWVQQAAKKSGISSKISGVHPSLAKARFDSAGLMRGLLPD
jgi:hypothetical protein